MQSNSLHSLIASVRRAMPRNVDVMALCDALEGLLARPMEPVVRPRFDKVAYQRELMRRRRAAARAAR